MRGWVICSAVATLLGSGCYDHHLLSGAAPSDGGTDTGIGPDPLPWCNEDGFCWESPLPQGNALLDIFAVSSDTVFAVGTYGTLLEYDGAHWQRHDAGTRSDLGAVWAADADDVWVGSAAAGDDGSLHRYDGRRWRRVPELDGHAVTSIAGLDADEVWLTTREGILRWDGRGIEEVDVGLANAVFFDVLLFARDDVWLLAWVMDEPEMPPVSVVMHYDGVSFLEVARGLGTMYPYGVSRLWGTGPDDVWAFGPDLYRLEGDDFVEMPSPEPDGFVLALWGTGPGDLHATHNGVSHWDGRRWTRAGDERSAAMHGTPEAVYRAVGYGALEVFEGGSWRPVFPERHPFEDGPLDASLFATMPVELWVGGATSAWGTGPDDVYRVMSITSPSVVEHWDGRRLAEVYSGGSIRDVHGSGSDNVWVLGHEVLAQWDGRTWRERPPPPGLNLFAVYTAGSDDTYAAGLITGPGGAVILHHDGERWTRALEVDELFAFADLEGRGGVDVWAVGYAAGRERIAVAHFDGRGFTVETVDAARGLSPDAIMLSGEQEVQIVAGDRIFERDGDEAWRSSELGFAADFPRRRVFVGPTGTWVTTPNYVVRRPLR